MDTRVTNHGCRDQPRCRDGEAAAYQTVLQAGTAVLVDDRGPSRVRGACGDPLLPPVAAQEETPRQTGKAWPGYRVSDVVVVEPSKKPVKEFVVVNPENGDWFERPADDTGDGDKQTNPPKDASASPTCPPGSDRPCLSSPGAGPAESSPGSQSGSQRTPPFS